jgi:hypothetical protein
VGVKLRDLLGIFLFGCRCYTKSISEWIKGDSESLTTGHINRCRPLLPRAQNLALERLDHQQIIDIRHQAGCSVQARVQHVKTPRDSPLKFLPKSRNQSSGHSFIGTTCIECARFTPTHGHGAPSLCVSGALNESKKRTADLMRSTGRAFQFISISRADGQWVADGRGCDISASMTPCPHWKTKRGRKKKRSAGK